MATETAMDTYPQRPSGILWPWWGTQAEPVPATDVTRNVDEVLMPVEALAQNIDDD